MVHRTVVPEPITPGSAEDPSIHEKKKRLKKSKPHTFNLARCANSSEPAFEAGS